MKNKNDCKIIQDLLPNYVEQLTSEETNMFVENHLKECNECISIFENMKKDLEKESDNIKREINYAKKYSLRLKILIAIIYTIISIIVAFFARNLIVFKSLANKMPEYLNATNYYLRIYDYQGWNASTNEYWVKDKTVLYKFNNVAMSFAKDGVLYNVFDEGYTVSEYTMKERDNYTFMFDFIENLKSELNNPKSILKYSLKNSIVNGKECYRLKNKSTIIYFEKETGLLVRIEELEGLITPSENEIQSTILDYKFEFDCVTDEDIELDISNLKQLEL